MTLAAQDTWTTEVADGVKTSFAIGFKVFDTSAIEVRLVNDATGVETLLTAGASYAITGTPGNYVVDFSGYDTPAAGNKVSIRSILSAAQSSEFDDFSKFPASLTEDALDRQAHLLQRVLGVLDRAVRVPADEAELIMPARSAWNDKVAVPKADGSWLLIATTDLEALAGRTSEIDALSTALRLAAIDAIYADLTGADTIGAAATLLGVAGPGLVAKNTTGTPVARTITGGTGISVSNGDGGAGNPALSLATSLQNIAGIAASANLFYVNNGSSVVGMSGDTALTALGGGTIGKTVFTGATAAAIRSTLGLGSAALAALIDEDDMASDSSTAAPTQQSVKAYVDSVAGSVADISAITPSANMFIRHNGTSWIGTSGADARSALGLTIGSQVQAHSAYLASIAAITPASNVMLFGNGAGGWTGLTGSAARSALGLGSIATQAANNVAITGGSINGAPVGASTASTGAFTDASVSGDMTLQGKFVFLKSPGAGVDALAAIHAARDAVGPGGTIMLAPGQDYEISGDVQMNVAGQTLHITAGASITSQNPTTGNAIDVTADNCLVCGAGALNHTGVIVGSYSAVGSGTGFRLLGNGLSFKDPLSRAINVVDVFGDDPVEIIGARVYWTAAGVVNAKAVLPLVINVETYDPASVGKNIRIEGCEVDYRAWSQEDLAEVLYPTSGSPNTIGVRVRTTGEETITGLKIENNRVIMPRATQGSASWDPVTYGNVADSAGQRRPTCFEVVAVRSTLNYSSKVGNFTPGETVTGQNSGASCVVGSDGTLSMAMYSRAGSFEPGETIEGGTSAATAVYGSVQGGIRDFTFRNNVALGGDLGFSFGGLDDCVFEGNYASAQTSYPLECATSQKIAGSGNKIGGAQAGKAVSCTNTEIVSLPGIHVECGENTAFAGTNTGVSFEGVGVLNLTGATIVAAADNISLLRVRTGTTKASVNLAGTVFLGDGHTGLVGLHFDQGTAETAVLTGALFRDIDTNSILVDSGVVVTNLVTTSVVGVNSGAFSNSGTITNHININNLGITGLSGPYAYDEASVNITGGSIAGITDLAVADGGTGASTAADARTNLGLGTGAVENVAAWPATTFVGDLTINRSTPRTIYQPTADTQNARFQFNNTAGAFRGLMTYEYSSDEFRWLNAGNGSTSKMSLDSSGTLDVLDGIEVNGAPVIDADRVHLLRSYTVATAPSAAAKGAGALIYATDGASGDPCLSQSDGTNWNRITHGVAISAT